MPEIRVQDEQGNIHVFPDGSTPEMIAGALHVKLQRPDFAQNPPGMPKSPNPMEGVAGYDVFGPIKDTLSTRIGQRIQQNVDLPKQIPAAADAISAGIKNIKEGGPSKLPEFFDALKQYQKPENVLGDIATGAIMGADTEIPRSAGPGNPPSWWKSTEPEPPAPQPSRLKALGKMAAQDAATHVPFVGRAFRRPSLMDYWQAATTTPEAPPAPAPPAAPPMRTGPPEQWGKMIENPTTDIQDRWRARGGVLATDRPGTHQRPGQYSPVQGGTVRGDTPAFKQLDSELSDVTPVTEQKFNIDRVANSARKVSNLKDAPPIAQKLLERASDATRPMSWPELRTFKSQVDTLISDPGIPSQSKGPLKNLSADIGTTLRQGADTRGQGEAFSKANADFRKSLKTQQDQPQELPEISPSKVSTTPPKSSQLAAAKGQGEPEIEAIRRGASESVQPQQAKAAQVQQAKRFTAAGTSEQPTPDIWQSAKQRFEESEAKRAQSQDPEARKEAREKKTAEKLSQVKQANQITQTPPSPSEERSSLLNQKEYAGKVSKARAMKAHGAKQARKQEIEEFMRKELAKPNIGVERTVPGDEDLTPLLKQSLQRLMERGE